MSARLLVELTVFSTWRRILLFRSEPLWYADFLQIVLCSHPVFSLPRAPHLQIPFFRTSLVETVCGLGRSVTMLGFGDMVVPGLLVSYLRQCDLTLVRYGAMPGVEILLYPPAAT